MITIEERRRVARVLRSYTAEDFAFNDPPCELACSLGIGCIGMDTCHGSDETPECTARSFARLADLIEPDTTSNTTKHTAYTTKCDRRALLALASDVDYSAEFACSSKPLSDMLHDIAHENRKACGESRAPTSSAGPTGCTA